MKNKDIWLEALSRASQVKGQLGTSDGRRCCLGVACDVAVAHDVVIDVKDYDPNISYDGELYILPERVVEFYDLESSSPSISADIVMPNGQTVWEMYRDRSIGGNCPDVDSPISLEELNDSGFSLEEISYLIEHGL